MEILFYILERTPDLEKTVQAKPLGTAIDSCRSLSLTAVACMGRQCFLTCSMKIILGVPLLT